MYGWGASHLHYRFKDDVQQGRLQA
jgi:hypothetical protein